MPIDQLRDTQIDVPGGLGNGLSDQILGYFQTISRFYGGKTKPINEINGIKFTLITET